MKPMVLGSSTYGYYNDKTKEFHCSHGGWSSPIDLIDDTTCEVKFVPSVNNYKFINEIPEDYRQ